MSFYTPLKKAKGLGSAKEGTQHFWVQRVSAIALIPLALWFVFSSLHILTFGAGYDSSRVWLAVPHNALLTSLLVFTALYHAYLGLRVIIEDYIHCEAIKISSFIAMQLGFIFIGAASLFAIITIHFEG